MTNFFYHWVSRSNKKMNSRITLFFKDTLYNFCWFSPWYHGLIPFWKYPLAWTGNIKYTHCQFFVLYCLFSLAATNLEIILFRPRISLHMDQVWNFLIWFQVVKISTTNNKELSKIIYWNSYFWRTKLFWASPLIAK